jgi:hypothetical protein
MSYYDRAGNPITSAEWARRLANEQRVAETEVPGLWISTVWLGLDHSFGGGRPLIFETMVFPAKGSDVTSWGELDSDRYSTEAEALAGHAAFVEKYRNGVAACNDEARDAATSKA